MLRGEIFSAAKRLEIGTFMDLAMKEANTQADVCTTVNEYKDDNNCLSYWLNSCWPIFVYISVCTIILEIHINNCLGYSFIRLCFSKG
jgi:hypothetical protein